MGDAVSVLTVSGAGLGDRPAKGIDQRVVDARVLDAGGCEKKL